MKKKSMFKLFSLLLTVFLVAGLFSPVATPSGHVALRLQSVLAETAASDPSQMVRVIVQKAAGTADAEAQVVALGGQVTRDLSIIHAFAAEMTAEAAMELAQNEAVRWVSLDAKMESTACT